MLNTQRPIFPVTRCLDIDGESKFLKVGFHIPGSALTQHEIVRRCAEFITTPFEEKERRPVLLQLLGIGLQDTHRVSPDGIPIKIKQDVAQCPMAAGVSRQEL